MRKNCVKRLVEQVGFTGIENEDLIVDLLSKLLEKYLETFAGVLRVTKRSEFSKDENLWNAFTSTLQRFKIRGIPGLHDYYYRNVIQEHDALYDKCIEKYEELIKP